MPHSLEGILDTLELMVAQANAYERALPADNYPARAAVATMGELARQALAEAHDLAELLSPTEVDTAPLSERELQVLGLVARGLTNRRIAYRLGLSERTIQFHLNGVFNKTGTGSRTEAVALAVSKRWIDPFHGRADE